jgi:hypothetical protein
MVYVIKLENKATILFLCVYYLNNKMVCEEPKYYK